MEHVGRFVTIAGIIIALFGLLLTFGPRLPFRLGRLPLDIHIQRDNFSFYFPLGTSIVVSLLLTLVFSIFNRR
jgi:hypothetical protein